MTRSNCPSKKSTCAIGTEPLAAAVTVTVEVEETETAVAGSVMATVKGVRTADVIVIGADVAVELFASVALAVMIWTPAANV